MKWLLPTDICVVTGGSNGLGHEILKELARHGCQTVSLDIKKGIASLEHREAVSSLETSVNQEEPRDPTPAKSTALEPSSNEDNVNLSASKANTFTQERAEMSRDWVAHGPAEEEQDLLPTLSLECDVRKESDLGRARQLIFEKFGRHPTLVVLSAGIRHPMRCIADSTFEDLQSTVDVNLGGVLKSLRTFLPDIIANNRGFFVIVASALGIVVPKGLGAYGATKAGLIGIHEGLVQEISNYKDIHSLLVCPGQLDSTMFSDVKTPSEILAPVVSTRKLAEKIVKRIRKAKTSTLYAPAYVRYLPFMNVVPVSVSRFLRHAAGVDSVYDNMVRKDECSGQSAGCASNETGTPPQSSEDK